jgi:DNA-binding transcriptional ArsR family regulator
MDKKEEQKQHKEHEKDIKKPSDIMLTQSSDYYLSFIFKKTEKLTVAVYMITDFFNDQEPLKWELRDKALHVLSFIGGFASTGTARAGTPFHRSVHYISEIVSLLDLAVSMKFISEMNAAVLREEYRALYTLIWTKERNNDPVGDFVFPQDFFDAEANDTDEQGAGNNPAGMARLERQPGAVARAATEGAPARADASSATHTRPIGEVSRRTEKNFRREAILKLLRTKRSASIKDISSLISNCSEKTVQRELMALINEGLVRRIGERRWSTYMLAPAKSST